MKGLTISRRTIDVTVPGDGYESFRLGPVHAKLFGWWIPGWLGTWLLRRYGTTPPTSHNPHP